MAGIRAFAAADPAATGRGRPRRGWKFISELLARGARKVIAVDNSEYAGSVLGAAKAKKNGAEKSGIPAWRRCQQPAHRTANSVDLVIVKPGIASCWRPGQGDLQRA